MDGLNLPTTTTTTIITTTISISSIKSMTGDDIFLIRNLYGPVCICSKLPIIKKCDDTANRIIITKFE